MRLGPLTLTHRIEDAIDRWNALDRPGRHECSGLVTSVSLQLAELGKLHKALSIDVERLEQKLTTAEALSSSAPSDDAPAPAGPRQSPPRA